jgi:hypothetical protein
MTLFYDAWVSGMMMGVGILYEELLDCLGTVMLLHWHINYWCTLAVVLYC